MINQLLNITKVAKDEQHIIDAMAQHSRIDDEEMGLLIRMGKAILRKQSEDIEELYTKIKIIHQNASETFEGIEAQIIQSDFNKQKQHDLLRIYLHTQRISETIILTARSMIIFSRLKRPFPVLMHPHLETMLDQTQEMHTKFHHCFTRYENNKKTILEYVHDMHALEQDMDTKLMNAIEHVYKLGNQEHLYVGTMRSIENIFESIEAISNKIQEATSSFEWLLIG